VQDAVDRGGQIAALHAAARERAAAEAADRARTLRDLAAAFSEAEPRADSGTELSSGRRRGSIRPAGSYPPS